jgi:hypothetical protein
MAFRVRAQRKEPCAGFTALIKEIIVHGLNTKRTVGKMDESRLPNGDVPRSHAYAGPFGGIVKSLRDDAVFAALCHDFCDQADKMSTRLRHDLDKAAEQLSGCHVQVGRPIEATAAKRQAQEFAKALSRMIANLDRTLAVAKASPKVDQVWVKAIERMLAHARDAIRKLEESRGNRRESRGRPRG